MASVRPISGMSMHAHAMDNLSFIRKTMERAGSFTAVPGMGGVAMGVTAFLAAGLASRQTTPEAWLAVWLAAAIVACSIGVFAAYRKARAVDLPLFSGPGRKFVLGLTPPMLAGAILTLAFWRAGQIEMLPGIWLLLYGAAVVTGGAASVRIVPAMGVCLMAAGAAALFLPLSWGDGVMAFGFGLLQVLFGLVIKVKYGG